MRRIIFLSLTLLALTACGSSTSSSTTTPSLATSTVPTDAHNDADVTFAQMMVVHHQGAITMSGLAATRSSSAAVKTLAAQIKAAQGPEITQMQGWLAAWGVATTTSMAMGSGMAMPSMAMGSDASSMPGMMSDAQMAQLTAASGSAFDKLFLQLMITHHQGALTMANTELAGGQNTAAKALATSIISSQTAQITQMQDMLKGR